MFPNNKQNGPNGKIDFFNILSYDDMALYHQLRLTLCSSQNRYNRNHKVQTFKNIIEKVLSFCEREENDKWKRYLVCGICRFRQFLAINNRQFGFLISKSKSAINDSILKMGYSSIQLKKEATSLLIEQIPFLYGNFSELKKWSIRIKNTEKSMNIDNQIENNVDEVDNMNNTFILSEDEDQDQENEELGLNDNVINNGDALKIEPENQFDIINFGENVNEMFDFNFGYELDGISSKLYSFSMKSNNKNKEKDKDKDNNKNKDKDKDKSY